jgi:hypothetical protein
MKRFFGVMAIVVGCLLGLSTTSDAMKIGVEGTLGKSSLGLVFYEDAYAGGVFYGQAQDETATVQSSTATVGAWAALRHKIDNKLFFNYGVNTYLKTGVYKGGNTLETFGLSPFVGFEYEATSHFLLTAWSNIIDYNTTKIGTSPSFTTTSLFQSYAGITYLF